MYRGTKFALPGSLLAMLASVSISAAGQIECLISRPARYYSGTNCAFSAMISTATPGTYLILATMYVNGEATATYTWHPGDPQLVGWDSDVRFDSTHFPDGQQITVSIDGWNNLGEYGGVANPPAPVYNKAFVFGNVVPAQGGIGNLIFGYQAARDIADYLRSANYTVAPASPTTAVNQRKDSILDRIPWATAFFGYTHGSPGIIC